MLRLNSASWSWHEFSTMRVMFPVSTASSITDVSTSVIFVGSTSDDANSAFSTLPETRSSTLRRNSFSNSDSSAARSVFSTPRVSRNSDCSERTSDLLARSISRSLTRSSIAENDSCSRWIARSRQSCSALVASRVGGRRAGVAGVGVAAMGGLDSLLSGVCRLKALCDFPAKLL